MPAFTAAAVSAVPRTRFATAIGVSSMFRQVGAALGAAAFVAIVGAPAPASAVASYRNGRIFMAVAAASGALLMALSGSRKPAPPVDAREADDVHLAGRG
jgi:hypothetical protein